MKLISGEIRRKDLKDTGPRGAGPRNRLSSLVVAAISPRQTMGRLKAGNVQMPCALGRSGVTRAKREGDGATPAGAFDLTRGYFRADRVARPPAATPLIAMNERIGWCDDPGSALYNREVALPCRAGHEKLWRATAVYDVVFVLDHNLHPRRKGAGSAIFFHLARPDLASTEGCVAIRAADMRRLIPRLSRHVTLKIRRS